MGASHSFSEEQKLHFLGCFEQLDTNTDGKLSVEELENMNQSAGDHKLSDEEMKDIQAKFAEMDSDNSGSVSFDEFIAYLEKHEDFQSIVNTSHDNTALHLSLQRAGVLADVEGLTDALNLGGALAAEYKDPVRCGAELSPPITHGTSPSVQFTPSGANAGKKYTLIMSDPDAPSRATHEFREFIHWVVSDITAESLASCGPVQGTTVVDYLGVGAPYNSGKHRYIFLLFEQPDEATPANLEEAFAGRGGKKACVAAKAAGLGSVVGVNFFESQWDESIDAIHIGMGWLPPPAYRSPNQQAMAAAEPEAEAAEKAAE